jgi:hypothetical protein
MKTLKHSEMKNIFTILACNAVSIACITAAGVNAYHKVDGWGWFLFVGAITARHVTKVTNSQDESQ